MSIQTTIDACTLADLDMIRKVYYMVNWAQAPGFWDYLIDRQAELVRNEHCVKYEITRDDFGHYASISETGAYKLLMAQLEAAAKALLEQTMSPYHVSDDGLDYLSAATDQASWISETLVNDDSCAAILKILNSTEDDLMNNTDGWGPQGFQYGYADHSGPISDLARFNYEKEEN